MQSPDDMVDVAGMNAAIDKVLGLPAATQAEVKDRRAQHRSRNPLPAKASKTLRSLSLADSECTMTRIGRPHLSDDRARSVPRQADPIESDTLNRILIRRCQSSSI